MCTHCPIHCPPYKACCSNWCYQCYTACRHRPITWLAHHRHHFALSFIVLLNNGHFMESDCTIQQQCRNTGWLESDYTYYMTSVRWVVTLLQNTRVLMWNSNHFDLKSHQLQGNDKLWVVVHQTQCHAILCAMIHKCIPINYTQGENWQCVYLLRWQCATSCIMFPYTAVLAWSSHWS